MRGTACCSDRAQLFKFQLNLEQNEAMCCIVMALPKKTREKKKRERERAERRRRNTRKIWEMRYRKPRVHLQPHSKMGSMRLSCP